MSTMKPVRAHATTVDPPYQPYGPDGFNNPLVYVMEPCELDPDHRGRLVCKTCGAIYFEREMDRASARNAEVRDE